LSVLSAVRLPKLLREGRYVLQRMELTGSNPNNPIQMASLQPAFVH
jgi:hypothetical protein